MTTLSQKLRALAATGRIANIPSVVSNVFLGSALANWLTPQPANHAATVSLLILSGICLLLAGNFFNDWNDRKWDKNHRPERALPQGLFSPGTFFAIASTFTLLGLGCAAAVNLSCLLVAFAICVFIVTYTAVHKHAAWAVVPMGMCRALLPVLGFAGFASPWSFAPALGACAVGLCCHIIGLSMSARGESMKSPPTGHLRFARLWFPLGALSLFFATLLGLKLPLVACIGGLLPYALWIALCLTVFRKPIHRHVSNLLAGIPLVDFILLFPLALAFSAGPLFLACLVIPPLAFLLGKALQRLAPAT